MLVTIYEKESPVTVYEKDKPTPIVVIEKEIPTALVIEEVDPDEIPQIEYIFDTSDWFTQSTFPNKDGEFTDSARP